MASQWELESGFEREPEPCGLDFLELDSVRVFGERRARIQRIEGARVLFTLSARQALVLAQDLQRWAMKVLKDLPSEEG